jgi:hypothetical protein
MNKKQILQLLNNPTIYADERERLQQLLHYMQVEGVADTSEGTANGHRKTSTRTAHKNKPSKSTTRTQQHPRQQ